MDPSTADPRAPSLGALPGPPAGYRARPVRPEADLDAIARMFLEMDLHDWGEPDYTPELIRQDWKLPRLDMDRDVVLLEDDGGAPAGYGFVYDRDRHALLMGWAAVHPDHRGRGLGTWLVAWQERRAAEHAELAPEGEPVLHRPAVIAPDGPAHELFERSGYRLVRHFWEMVVDLPEEPEAPRWPPDVSVRAFERDRDEPAVHAAVQEAFADHWGSTYTPFDEWVAMRIEHPEFRPELSFLAMAGEDVAAVLLSEEAEGYAWVATLGTRPAWRRRGLGEALLRQAFGAFRGAGLSVAKLNVDSTNPTGATRLYERVGMRVAKQYDDYEKRIR